MKKCTFVLFSLFATISVSAQEVLSSQGDSYSNGSGSIDFTIGEVVINTGTDGTNNLTQGFHQTNWNFVGLEDFASNFEATIFPNPTEDVLNIRTSTFENVTYTLYDAQGKLVMQDILSAEQAPIQVSQLAPGAYSLTLTSELFTLNELNLLHKLRLQPHCPKTINLAINIVITISETDVFDFRAGFDTFRHSFYGKVFDDRYAVAIL
jgi:hypothetical protein